MALNPEDENAPVAVWKIMKPGTHAAIVTALEADADIKGVLAAFKSNPNGATRDKAVDTIVRFTGNCIGQAALAEAQDKSPSSISFTPKDASRSIFKTLQDGEKPIFTAIDADAQTRNALHQGHDDVTISLISRMTGRCVGQTLFQSGIGFFAAVAKL
jgi:hypothetical protein